MQYISMTSLPISKKKNKSEVAPANDEKNWPVSREYVSSKDNTLSSPGGWLSAWLINLLDLMKLEKNYNINIP